MKIEDLRLTEVRVTPNLSFIYANFRDTWFCMSYGKMIAVCYDSYSEEPKAELFNSSENFVTTKKHIKRFEEWLDMKI